MISSSSASGQHTTDAKPLRIVVVDDHVFMRELISSTLDRQPARYSVVASVGTAAAAIEQCEQVTPDLLILDINLPDQNGIDAVPTIRRVSPQTHVLLCTAFASEDRILDSLRVGAKGFVEKTNTWDEFLVAVDRVGRGEQYFCAKSAGIIPPPNGAARLQASETARALLSRREQQVIELIAHGHTSKEIAAKLFISSATVETHRTNVMSKLGVRNVAGLVLYAFQNGLADAGATSLTT